MKLTYLIVISSIILISACTESLPGEESVGKVENSEQELPGDELVIVNTELVDREWILNSLDGEQLIEGTNIILAFEISSFSGFAGCNGYGGPYEMDGKGGITFVEYSSQAEGCIEPEGVLDQEINYMNQLMDVKQYSVDSEVLTLSIPESGGKLIYLLRKEFKMDPVLLNNSRWQLLPSEDFPLIDGSVITIMFVDGKMEGLGGCRDFKGEYQAEVDQIRFPLTMMIGEICEDEDLLIQEGKFTTALELTIHYQIQDDQLKLFLATGEELLFASTD